MYHLPFSFRYKQIPFQFHVKEVLDIHRAFCACVLQTPAKHSVYILIVNVGHAEFILYFYFIFLFYIFILFIYFIITKPGQGFCMCTYYKGRPRGIYVFIYLFILFYLLLFFYIFFIFLFFCKKSLLQT